MKKPLAVRDQLVSMNPENNIIYSPDGRYLLTGLAADPKENLGGRIALLDKTSLEICRTICM